MSESGKPKCGSCGGSRGSVEAATPIDTSMIPSSCAPASTSTCACPPPVADCCDDTPCLEDHTKVYNTVRYSFTLKVRNSFNWPADGDDVVLSVKDVTSILPGTMLWNPTIGYLYVQSFDGDLQQITARNKGDSCNIKEAGDLIPKCVDFVVGPVPCGGGNILPPNSNTPYLAADFISPAEGECQVAKVTTIVGLQLGDIVSIASYKYTIKADDGIIDNETIILCNTGDGAAEGTLIKSDPDCNGTPDVPVLVISSVNPCTLDSVNAGVIIGCVDGNPVPIVGTIDGQILVWNSLTLRWELRTVNIPEGVCTTLTSELALDPDRDPLDPYLVTVADSSIFAANDSIEIDGSPDGTTFTVTDIVDATHIHVIPDFTVNVIHEYESGEVVCMADCCVGIQKQIDTIEANLNGFRHIETLSNAVDHSIDTVGGPTSYESTHLSWTVTNPNPDETLSVATNIVLIAGITVAGDNIASSYLAVTSSLLYIVDGGPTGIIQKTNTTTFIDNADEGIQQDTELSVPLITDIPPGGSKTFEVYAQFSVVTQPAGGGGIADINPISIIVGQLGTRL